MLLLLQGPVATCLTPLQLMLSIAHSDLRLVNRCLAMEIHFIKPLMHSSYVVAAFRGSLVGCDEGYSWKLVCFFFSCALAVDSPSLWICIVHHFVIQLVWLPALPFQYKALKDDWSTNFINWLDAKMAFYVSAMFSTTHFTACVCTGSLTVHLLVMIVVEAPERKN